MNGKSFQNAVKKDGIVYVPLKPFIKKLGDKVLFESATDIIEVIPGNSPVSQSSVQEIVKENNAAENNSSLESFNLSASAPVVPYLKVSQTENINPSLAQFLVRRGNAIYYITRLNLWQTKFIVQIYSLLPRMQSEIRDNSSSNSMNSFSSVMLDMINSEIQIINNWKENLNQITPPVGFQDSYAALRVYIRDSTTLFSSLFGSLANMLQSSSSHISKIALLKKYLPAIMQIQSDLNTYQADLQSDFRNLPQSNSVQNVNPQVLLYLNQLQTWEDQYFLAGQTKFTQFSNSSLQNLNFKNPNSAAQFNQLMESLENFYSQSSQAFSQINPPAQFQNSQSALQIMANEYGKNEVIFSQLQTMVSSAAQSKNEIPPPSSNLSAQQKLQLLQTILLQQQEQMSEATYQTLSIMRNFNEISIQMQIDGGKYLSTLKSDLKNYNP